MSMKIHPLMTGIALALLTATQLTQAQPTPAGEAPPPDALSLKTQRVVIFKDGYGLVIKEGRATADGQGHVYTTQVPESAVLGTVWALSDQGQILSMTAQWDKKHETRKEVTPALTMRELLRANLHHRITVELNDKRSIIGTASEILETAEKTAVAAPLPADAPQPDTPSAPFTVETDTPSDPFASMLRDMEYQAQRYGNPADAARLPEGAQLVRELAPRGGDFVVIDGENDRMVLPIAKIVAVSGKDIQTAITREKEIYRRSKRLVLDFGKPSAEKPVSVRFFYFTPGFRWVPTYRINGNLKDQAVLALQGEIINDYQDIADAGVDLVVGVPNFRFKDVVSPLVLERELRNLPAVVNRDNNNQMVQSQTAFYNGNRSTGSGEAPNPGLPAELAAGSGGEQDLFVYPLEKFSLTRGGRATAALWQNTVPVRNVYTYEIKARHNRISGGQVLTEPTPGNPNGPNRIVLNQIWHQLELANSTKVPWTTGAALTMRDNLPLGQDLLPYTSVGGKTLLPLTIAVDLRGTSDEEEISRKPNAAHLDDNDYTLVQKKGTITVSSSRKEPSEVCISVGTGGKVEAASEGGKIKINDFRAEDWDDGSYMRVNNHSDISWEFTLKSGESKTVDYTVSFYVR